MRTGWRRWLDDRFMAGLGLAFVLFASWQVLNHYVLMDLFMARLGLSMLYYHYVSFVVEMCFATLVVVFASGILSAKNQELEELHRQKDLLTDTLVHDLRQPLTAVIGGLSSATLAPDLPSTTRELVEIAHAGANELLGMVNDLLDISRLEAGRSLLNRQQVDLARVVEAGVAPVAELARERGQTLTLEPARDLPPVNADSGRLGRVVTNLVGNAIKFTPAGGAITVRAERSDDGGSVAVSISDTGPGIPREAQRVIFDKFASLGPATDGARTSTGLGLAFCKAIVEAHGGHIEVASAPGKGSTFTFSVPVRCDGLACAPAASAT